MGSELDSWNEGVAKLAIQRFVEQTIAMAVPLEERVAVFDADGTLWPEKPVPVEVNLILERMAEMAKSDPELRDRQPWKAAYTHDTDWLNDAIAEHYAGDETKAKILMAGVATTFAGITVEDFEADAGAFLRHSPHPSRSVGYLETAYVPMVDLLQYLAANGFSNYIVSGSGADFMRAISLEMFGIPPERVIGSETALEYVVDDSAGKIIRKGALGFLDDGNQKPIQTWNRIGRRPLLAGGNSNGDLPMLSFTKQEAKPSLRLLIAHDDSEREYAYVSGAEQALDRADTNGITVVSMKNDFATVFAGTGKQ